MLWCLLHSMKNRERVEINILQTERTKLRGKVLLSKPLQCVRNRGTNPDFSTQTKLCFQIAESGVGSPSSSQFPVQNRGDPTCKLLYIKIYLNT